MEGIEAVCFQIISFAGSAKSCYMEAIGAAEQDDYDKAKALMAEGDSCFHEGPVSYTHLDVYKRQG